MWQTLLVSLQKEGLLSYTLLLKMNNVMNFSELQLHLPFSFLEGSNVSFCKSIYIFTDDSTSPIIRTDDTIIANNKHFTKDNKAFTRWPSKTTRGPREDAGTTCMRPTIIAGAYHNFKCDLKFSVSYVILFINPPSISSSKCPCAKKEALLWFNRGFSYVTN